MFTSFKSPLSLYGSVNQLMDTVAGGEPKKAEGTPDFMDVLNDVGKGLINDIAAGEKAMKAGAVGQADIVSITTAVSQAEMALVEMTTIRDKAVAAYQEILRMPV